MDLNFFFLKQFFTTKMLIFQKLGIYFMNVYESTIYVIKTNLTITADTSFAK